MDNLLVLKDECPKIDPLLREISDTQNVGSELRKMVQKFGELKGKILITNGADTKKVSCIKILIYITSQASFYHSQTCYSYVLVRNKFQ